jgi:6,7-dimethyl-8-ribityllumazine synthase
MHQKTHHPENFVAQAPDTEVGALRYAFIHAGWHADIVHKARDSFLTEMQLHGVARDAIDVFEVPGAFELPLLAKKLARTGRYAAVVACALVVDGGIYRHEFVADAVVAALMAVQLELGIPVLSVVLTPHHFHAGDEHQAFFAAHFVLKGAEAARACIRTVRVLRSVDELTPA